MEIRERFGGSIVLDGGLASELERRGADLRDRLWSARLLIEGPELIRQVHLAYFEAGADVAISASYQASFEGFAARGVDRQGAASLLTRSVQLAREAAEESGSDRLVAASVGPYGAMRADGSEYSGRYGVSVEELVAFHQPRLEVLLAAEPDLLAVETIPSIQEAEAIVTVLDRYPEALAWIAFSCRDEDRLSDGTPFRGGRHARRLERSGRRGRRELHAAGIRPRTSAQRGGHDAPPRLSQPGLHLGRAGEDMAGRGTTAGLPGGGGALEGGGCPDRRRLLRHRIQRRRRDRLRPLIDPVRVDIARSDHTMNSSRSRLADSCSRVRASIG